MLFIKKSFNVFLNLLIIFVFTLYFFGVTLLEKFLAKVAGSEKYVYPHFIETVLLKKYLKARLLLVINWDKKNVFQINCYL